MPGDFIDFRHEVIRHLVAGAVFLQHLLFCSPGDWPEIKAEIGDVGECSEIRYEDGLVVLSPLIPASLDSPWNALPRGNSLRAPADDDRLV